MEGRHLVVSGPTDAQVARILRLIGRDTPEDRERFGRAERRMANGDELDALVAEWVASQRAEEATAALEAARIPVSEANDLAALAAHPQVRHRASLIEVTDDRLGAITMPAPHPALGLTPPRIGATGPDLGAHTGEVLGEWLGGRRPPAVS